MEITGTGVAELRLFAVAALYLKRTATSYDVCVLRYLHVAQGELTDDECIKLAELCHRTSEETATKLEGYERVAYGVSRSLVSAWTGEGENETIH